LIDETVENFNDYINPGFLKYRKSFSPEYVAGMSIAAGLKMNTSTAFSPF
jgi:hypothetical protein